MPDFTVEDFENNLNRALQHEDGADALTLLPEYNEHHGQLSTHQAEAALPRLMALAINRLAHLNRNLTRDESEQDTSEKQALINAIETLISEVPMSSGRALLDANSTLLETLKPTKMSDSEKQQLSPDQQLQHELQVNIYQQTKLDLIKAISSKGRTVRMMLAKPQRKSVEKLKISTQELSELRKAAALLTTQTELEVSTTSQPAHNQTPSPTKETLNEPEITEQDPMDTTPDTSQPQAEQAQHKPTIEGTTQTTPLPDTPEPMEQQDDDFLTERDHNTVNYEDLTGFYDQKEQQRLKVLHEYKEWHKASQRPATPSNPSAETPTTSEPPRKMQRTQNRTEIYTAQASSPLQRLKDRLKKPARPGQTIEPATKKLERPGKPTESSGPSFGG